MSNQLENAKSAEPEDNFPGTEDNTTQEDIFNSKSKSTIEPGDGFGDFSKITEKKYIPCYAIVESDSAKLLKLNRNDVDNLGKFILLKVYIHIKGYLPK